MLRRRVLSLREYRLIVLISCISLSIPIRFGAKLRVGWRIWKDIGIDAAEDIKTMIMVLYFAEGYCNTVIHMKCVAGMQA